MATTILMTYFLLFEPKLKSKRSNTFQSRNNRNASTKYKSIWARCYSRYGLHWTKGSTRSKPKDAADITIYQKKQGRKKLPIIILQSEYEDQQPQEVKFDTDSKKLRIDNGASKSMSPHIEDFIDVPTDTNRTILGIASSTNSTKEGTIEWRIEDDEGKTHII